MEKREKLIRVVCCYDECRKPFHLRVKTQQADAEGAAEVGVNCPYCGGKVMVKLEKEFIEPGDIVRTTKGEMPH